MEGFLSFYSLVNTYDWRCVMHIGERIQRLRERQGWTQQELADKAKVSQPLISRLANQVQHQLHSDALKRLARTLGCTADYLIGMYEDEESELKPAAVA